MFTDQGNGQWNTPMSSRPDSLIGWFKATPQTGDRANIGVLLHVDEGRLPAFGTEANWVGGASWKAPYGTVNDWTRFSTPFNYTSAIDPEWILFILTAGDSAGSQVGTQAWFDDMALIYNVSCEPQEPIASVSATTGYPLLVDYSTGGIPTGPTEFTVELSDATGSFDAPVVIGSLTSTSPTGIIPCTVPAGTVPGAGYQLRVVTPSPLYAWLPSGLQVEAATGLADREIDPVRIWCTAGMVNIDLRAAGMQRPAYELFDSNGRMIASGTLQPHALNQLGAPLRSGLLLIRVTHATGVLSRRVLCN